MVKLIDWEMRKYIKGNFTAFGWGYQGWTANLCLLSPAFSRILNWRSRNYALVIDGITDGYGRVLPGAPTCFTRADDEEQS